MATKLFKKRAPEEPKKPVGRPPPTPWICPECGMPNPFFDFVCRFCSRGTPPSPPKD